MAERAEKLNKMSKLEIEVNSKIAAELYDKFGSDTKKNAGSKEIFILGYLHGIEKAYNEIGMYDSSDDDMKVLEFIEKNIDRLQK